MSDHNDIFKSIQDGRRQYIVMTAMVRNDTGYIGVCSRDGKSFYTAIFSIADSVISNITFEMVVKQRIVYRIGSWGSDVNTTIMSQNTLQSAIAYLAAN